MDDYLERHTRRYVDEGKLLDEFGEEVADIKKRFSILPGLMEQHEIRAIDFLMIWSDGHIIILSNGKIHFYMFKPLSYQVAVECQCSYDILTYHEWPIAQSLKKAVAQFRLARAGVDPNDAEAFSPLLENAWVYSWKYSYLFCAWRTPRGFDCLFADDPLQPGKKGKSYYRDLLLNIKRIILPWKRQYLLDHHMIPKEQLPFLRDDVYTC